MNDQADAFVEYLTDGWHWSLERFRTHDLTVRQYYYTVGQNHLTDADLTQRAKEWLESKGKSAMTEDVLALFGAVSSKLGESGGYPTPNGSTARIKG